MDSSDKPTVLLEYYLKRLKLATMLKEYAAVAKLCGQEREDYLIFLLRLAEREALRREERAFRHSQGFPEREGRIRCAGPSRPRSLCPWLCRPGE